MIHDRLVESRRNNSSMQSIYWREFSDARCGAITLDDFRAHLRMRGTRMFIIGDSPQCKDDPLPCLHPMTSSGWRLADLLGVKDVREVAMCENLFPSPAEELKSVTLARAHDVGLMPGGFMYMVGLPIVLLGRRVRDIVTGECPWLSTSGPHVILPHPSGKNYWWNEGNNRERARNLLRGLLHEPGNQVSDGDR